MFFIETTSDERFFNLFYTGSTEEEYFSRFQKELNELQGVFRHQVPSQQESESFPAWVFEISQKEVVEKYLHQLEDTLDMTTDDEHDISMEDIVAVLNQLAEEVHHLKERIKLLEQQKKKR